MGIDITQAVIVGYKFSREEVEKIFGKSTPEESHLEKRFDPQTGARLQDVRVITKHSYIEYFYKSEKVDYDELLNILSKKLAGNTSVTSNCFAYCYGDYMCGQEFVIFGYDKTECSDAGRCPEDSEINLETVISRKPDYERLARMLQGLGFKVGDLQIHNCYTIS